MAAEAAAESRGSDTSGHSGSSPADSAWTYGSSFTPSNPSVRRAPQG